MSIPEELHNARTMVQKQKKKEQRNGKSEGKSALLSYNNKLKSNNQSRTPL